MNRFTRKNLITGSVALCCALFAANSLRASISTIKGKGKYKTTFSFVNNILGNNANTDAGTVPAGQTLVITDFIFVNSFAGANGLVMKKQKVDTTTVDVIPFLGVPTGESFEHSYSSGIEFSAGEHVLVRTVNGVGGVSLNGYFKT